MRQLTAALIIVPIAAALLAGGCSSNTPADACANITTASATDFLFDAAPGTTVRVITSGGAERLCHAELDVEIRYEDNELSRASAPQNIQVEFAVEDDSGKPPTIFAIGDPEYSTLYRRKYIRWNATVSSRDRMDMVRYYIRIGTDSNGDDPVLVDAVIKYAIYPSPSGIMH